MFPVARPDWRAVPFSMPATCLFPLLLLFFSLSAAAAPLRFPEQYFSAMGLKEARVIAVLNGYAIIAGRSCTDCDENTAIYIHRISPQERDDVSDITSGERYTYPGEYIDYMSKELVEKTRLFYGRCYENQPSLLWLSEYRVNGGWVKSEYLILLGEEGLQHRYNENRQPAIHHIRNRGCIELPGITAETEP